MAERHPLVEKLRGHLETTGLIPSGTRGLVGYSGGADSTFLVHAFHALGFDFVAGHLHHGQRPEGDDEMLRCERFCESLGVPFASGRANVPLLSKEAKIGLEEAGRQARYDFFNRAARRLDCEWVATAHTLDDQIETVLFNLTRGSGLSGLGGIPVRRGQVIRPILGLTRQETRSYCTELGLWFHDDPANSDPAFSRSRIRMNVVPELLEINPSLGQAVTRLSEIARQEDAFLDYMAAAALERCEVPIEHSLGFLTQSYEALFVRDTLKHLPSPLLRRALRLVTESVGGALDYELTGRIEQALFTEPKGAVTTEGGRVHIEWNANELAFRRSSMPKVARMLLQIEGQTVSESLGWCFEIHTTDPKSFARKPRSLSVVIDSDQVRGQVFCRGTKPGDAFQPLGLKGTKKLSDLLGETGLSQVTRRLLPIVCDMVGIIWVPGVSMSDRVKVTSSTSSAFELRFGIQVPHPTSSTET